MWKSLVDAVRKMPIAKWIKPLWKGGLKMGVKDGGDQLQAEINKMLEREGVKALPKIHARVDRLQERFGAIVDALPLPPTLETKIKIAVNKPVDLLQKRIEAGCAMGCEIRAKELFNDAFDRFQVESIERIDAF